jgi:condensin complex subunit 3
VLRKTVFAGSLSSTALPDCRVLTVAQREEVVRNGLGDRDPAVRKAAAAMLGGWLEQAEGELLEVCLLFALHLNMLIVVQFLGRFDITTSQVAEEALLSIFVTRSEVLDTIELDGESFGLWTIYGINIHRCVLGRSDT